MDEATFIVHWTDYVANEWTEIVRGPATETDERLTDLAERGQREFGMNHFQIGDSSRPIEPTLTTAQFFNDLDWSRWLPKVLTDR